MPLSLKTDPNDREAIIAAITAMTDPSMFRTAEGQARYFAAYAETLALWPVSVDSFAVPTRFGPTHINACGPEGAAPLILLHGQAMSSTMWSENAGAFSGAHRVYAVDILGDMGKSVSNAPNLKTVDFGAWLGDVLDALQLDSANVAGLSYGGYIALRLAVSAPGRIRKLILMAPAGVLPVPLSLFFRILSGFLPLPFNTRMRLILGADIPNAAPVVRQMLTRSDFRYQTVLPTLLTDDELARIEAPSLLLIGEKDVAVPPVRLIARLENRIPNLEIRKIPGASHFLPVDRPDLVNAAVLAFLA